MSVRATDIVLSTSLGLLAIIILHCSILVYACLETGGSIDLEAFACLDENYHEQYFVISGAWLVAYLLLGIAVSLACAFSIRRIRVAKSERGSET